MKPKKIDDERTKITKPFSYEKMKFRYKYVSKFLNKGSVLDIGCGHAYGLKYLPECNYTGIDYYQPALDDAKKMFPDANFLQMTLPNLNFENETFDNILCLEFIEHITREEGEILLKEAHRVLKKGGKFFLTTPNSDNKNGIWRDHILEYSKKEMESMIQKEGFFIEKFSGMLDSTLWKGLQKLKPEKGDSSQSRTGSFSLRTHNPITKTILRIIANLVIYIGYYRPNKAIHQMYVCRRTP